MEDNQIFPLVSIVSTTSSQTIKDGNEGIRGTIEEGEEPQRHFYAGQQICKIQGFDETSSTVTQQNTNCNSEKAALITKTTRGSSGRGILSRKGPVKV